MLITSFPAGPLQANCYFVAAGPGSPCAVIDPGMDSLDGVKAVAEKHNLNITAVLVTHGHFDHMWQAADVAREFDADLWIHPGDRHLLTDPLAAISGPSAAMLRQQFGLENAPEFTEPSSVKDAIDGAQIHVGALTFTVDHTPGHTPGTVAYRIDYNGPEPVSQLMFSGDFLFYGSIGRTDLTGGNHAEMMESLRTKVLPLPDDVVVLPGHGQQTSIAREKQTNPYLAELMS